MVIYTKKEYASWYIKIILLFVPDEYWITIWDTVYYPNAVEDIFDPEYDDIKAHEAIHVPQWKKYKILFPILYLVIPFPIFFAYFRWLFEREAYLVNIKSGHRTVDSVVFKLWWGYLFTWPPNLMRKWFNEQLGENDD